ncbi:type VI secretion system Vgr family protein [Thioalkalivibrio sp. ALE18]|uniref:type VI secretion system Vgr family protein n=1 Tax=Thioalkalivibrio sp. ALE18 TaxID=1158174 RepID=UPI000373B45D|nr:type VI secretion system tip protein TssI/VgrG [Thioalkalivibrio sp. ALE18]
MPSRNGLFFTLARAGVAPEPLPAVTRFTLDEALSRPFTLSLDLVHPSPDLDPDDWIDQDLALAIHQDGQVTRRVHGIVTDFERGRTGARRTAYRLVVRPALWRLALRRNARIFQQADPLDVIHTLLAEHGIGDAAFNILNAPEPREYLVQYRESDLDFIHRLAAELGIRYFHEFDDDPAGGHRPVFSDTHRGLLHLGERPCRPRAGGRADERHIHRLQETARLRPHRATLEDRYFRNPRRRLLHEEALDTPVEAYEHYDFPGRFQRDPEATAFTRVRLQQLRADAHTAEIESDLPELRPGTRFTLDGHDSGERRRDWQVVGALHEGHQPQALEEDAVLLGDTDPAERDGVARLHNHVTLVPADRDWRPPYHPDQKPRVDGPQIARVVGPEGEEIHCDEHARVKLRFPWDRYAEDNEHASAWIRVAQAWAGPGYGSVLLPRIGHAVIVDFLEGDPDRPVVTGAVHDGDNPPPYPLPEHKTRSVLRTRSHQADGYNELRFDDARDAEQIHLHAQRDLDLITRNDRSETIERHSHLGVHGDRLAEVRGNEHLTVQGERREHTAADQHLTVDGTLHQRFGTAQLVEAGREIHHAAGTKIVLDAGAEITLEAGGSFIKIDPSGVTVSGPNVRLNSGGSPGSGSPPQVQMPEHPRSADASPRSRSSTSGPAPGAGADAIQEASMAEGTAERERELLVDITSGSEDGRQVRLRQGRAKPAGGQH